MKRLIIAAVGLALVGGIIICSIVGNPFGRSRSANAQEPTPTPNGATATAIAAATATALAPTNTPVPVGSGCYTNWNSASCATGWTAVATGEWTVIIGEGLSGPPTGAAVICAAPKVENVPADAVYGYSDTASGSSNGSHLIQHEPCAICCGSNSAGSPSVVGGVAQFPDLATRSGPSGMGGGAYAVLGAVGGVLALTVAGTVASKRRGGQQ